MVRLQTTGTSVTLTSATNFPSSGTVHIKIDNEIMSGTISGTTISSITRGQGSTTSCSSFKWSNNRIIHD